MLRLAAKASPQVHFVLSSCFPFRAFGVSGVLLDATKTDEGLLQQQPKGTEAQGVLSEVVDREYFGDLATQGNASSPAANRDVRLNLSSPFCQISFEQFRDAVVSLGLENPEMVSREFL